MAQTYPELEVKKILANIAIYIPELKIAKQNFDQPTQEFWTSAFQIILTKLLDVPYEELFPENVHMKYDREDFYERSLNLMLIYKHMQVAMNICKCTKFSLRDVLYPEKTRLQDVLSASCNYLIFKESREPIIKELLAERDLIVKEIEHFQDKKSEMLNLKDTLLYNMKDDTTMEKVLKDIADVKAESDSKLEKMNMLKVISSEIKVEIEKTSAEKEKMKKIIETLTTDMVNLEKLICQSPEQMILEIEELKKKKHKIEVEIKKIPVELIELQRLGNVLTTMLGSVFKLNNFISNIKESEINIKEHKEKLKFLDSETYECNKQKQILNLTIKNKESLKERLETASIKFQEKVDEQKNISKTIEELKEKMALLLDEKSRKENVLSDFILQHNMSEDKTDRICDELYSEQKRIILEYKDKADYVTNEINEANEKLKILNKEL